jgi:hypothetical protein
MVDGRWAMATTVFALHQAIQALRMAASTSLSTLVASSSSRMGASFNMTRDGDALTAAQQAPRSPTWAS